MVSRTGFFRVVVFLLLFVIGGLGCATRQTQRMYFAASDLDSGNPTLKFYRVTIDAEARNMTSTLQTGYYDAGGVRALYGEVKPPEESTEEAARRIGSYQLVYKDGQWQAVDPNMLYTIVYGTDAKAIAKAINAFAQSEQLGERLGRLILATQEGVPVRELEEAKAQEKAASAESTEVAKKLTAFAAELEEMKKGHPSPEQVRLVLLKAAQELANHLGAVDTFDAAKINEGFEQARAFYSERQGTSESNN